jgi:hypothetical protein
MGKGDRMRRWISKPIIATMVVVGLIVVGVALSFSLLTQGTGGSKSTTTTRQSSGTPTTSAVTPESTSSVPFSFSSSTSSSTTAVDKTSTQIIGDLVAKISLGSSPISRGSTQSIWVEVANPNGPMSNTTLSIMVLDASGQTSLDFVCATNATGDCWTLWVIGGDSTPGIFQVSLTAEGTTFHSSFEVTTS